MLKTLALLFWRFHILMSISCHISQGGVREKCKRERGLQRGDVPCFKPWWLVYGRPGKLICLLLTSLKEKRRGWRRRGDGGDGRGGGGVLPNLPELAELLVTHVAARTGLGMKTEDSRSERLPPCIDINTWSKDRSGWRAGILDGDLLTLKTE